MNDLKLIKIGAAIIAASFVFSTKADDKPQPQQPGYDLVLSYDGFFDRIKKFDDPEFSNVKLAFYLKTLKTNQACKINSVYLKTKLKSKKVYFYETGEIVLPFDIQLDLDKANVVINKQTDEECGLDMRIESVALLNKTMTKDEINSLINTFKLALDKQAGMMSFLLPEVKGVTFVGEQGKSLAIKNTLVGSCSEKGCSITKSDLDDLYSEEKLIEFNAAPVKAVPFIQQ